MVLMVYFGKISIVLYLFAEIYLLYSAQALEWGEKMPHLRDRNKIQVIINK